MPTLAETTMSQSIPGLRLLSTCLSPKPSSFHSHPTQPSLGSYSLHECTPASYTLSVSPMRRWSQRSGWCLTPTGLHRRTQDRAHAAFPKQLSLPWRVRPREPGGEPVPCSLDLGQNCQLQGLGLLGPHLPLGTTMSEGQSPNL